MKGEMLRPEDPGGRSSVSERTFLLQEARKRLRQPREGEAMKTAGSPLLLFSPDKAPKLL